ncbi:MAG: ribosome maturation factor RimM [Actinobacteria bacterium]|nr:ribosome maturation factor RimM [Actinomycetota bacterium]
MTNRSNPDSGPPLLLEVGRINRVHGLRGDVVVNLTSNVEGRLATGSTFNTDAEAHGRTLVVGSSRRHQDRWLVRFEGVASREAADALGRPNLYAEPVDDPGAMWIHQLFGSVVVDDSGVERGRVVEVHDNPASELLQLDTGHLVPIDFVTSTEPDRITVSVPDGLWDL